MALDIISDYRPIIENVNDYRYRYLVYLSGRMGLAKSTNIARCLLTIGMMKRLRIACIRETMNSIKDSVHAQLSEEIIANGLPYVIYRESIVCPATGTEIIFKGLRETNQHNIRSMANVDVAFVEEAQAVTPTSWESFAPTIRKLGSFIILAGNPDQESDIIYQLFGEDAERRPDTFYCYKDFRYNPFKMPEATLQEIALMKKNRPDDYERIYLGKLRKSSDFPVVKEWSEENIGIGNMSQKIYWALDFNFLPQCSVICHWNGGHEFYFSDEIVLENASTYKVAEKFAEIYKKKYRGQKVVINGDASGKNR
jgi:PBSX family phage terminase large subunit